LVFSTAVGSSLDIPTATSPSTIELPSEEALDVDGFFGSSRGNGFLACSALNPGGGNPDPPTVDDEVSVA
jgi:hypothetical protein